MSQGVHIDSEIQSLLESLRSTWSSSAQNQTEFENTVNRLSNVLTRQHGKKTKDKQIEFIENSSKVLKSLINAKDKFKSKDPNKVAEGMLNIISDVIVFLDGAGSVEVALMRTCIAVLEKIKPIDDKQGSSVVEQFAEVVHEDLVRFNRKLQDQKLNGLKRRVSDQAKQLHNLKPGERLDDPNLGNDYIQFLGELSTRFEAPLDCKVADRVCDNPDAEDFVTALVTYCHAHTCLMSLLFIAKGRFTRAEDRGRVSRRIDCQIQDAKKRLQFLSERKYLTFLGRLPYVGGKLTKILCVCRNVAARHQVQVVRNSLALPDMPSSYEVELAAKRVAKLNVRLRLQEHDPVGVRSRVSAYNVQFINNTKFPMKIVSGQVGDVVSNLSFVQDVQPGKSYYKPIVFSWPVLSNLWDFFSTGGFILIYHDGNCQSSPEPSNNATVLEFAMSWKRSFRETKSINIQDKTNSEFTRGFDTYENMVLGQHHCTVYWSNGNEHYIADAEVLHNYLTNPLTPLWRFVVQSFDPAIDAQSDSYVPLWNLFKWGLKRNFQNEGTLADASDSTPSNAKRRRVKSDEE